MLPMFDLLRDLERLTQAAYTDRTSARLDWPARLDVFGRDGALHITVDLPGVDRDDIDLQFDDDQVTIRAERRCEPDPTDRVVCLERPYGTFSRTVRVGRRYDPSQASAALRHGVLRITVPTRASTPASSIPISTDAQTDATTDTGSAVTGDSAGS